MNLPGPEFKNNKYMGALLCCVWICEVQVVLLRREPIENDRDGPRSE